MEEGSLFQRMKNIFQVEDEKLDEGMQKEAAVLIRNIFRYMDKDAKDIMTHRKNIAAIDEEELLEDALHFMLEENYSRFPIYHEDIDEITGFLHLREAVSCYLNENLRKVPVKDLTDYIRPAYFVPESKSIDTLFKKCRRKRSTLWLCWMNTDRPPDWWQWKIFWKRSWEISWTNMTRRNRWWQSWPTEVTRPMA